MEHRPPPVLGAQVLDGCTIDASEQAAAKSRYAGRLTLDYLEEKIGHKFFTHIRELDISGLRIRDVHSVFAGEEFESLLVRVQLAPHRLIMYPLHQRVHGGCHLRPYRRACCSHGRVDLGELRATTRHWYACSSSQQRRHRPVHCTASGSTQKVTDTQLHACRSSTWRTTC
jgi:hypothetical protein